MDLRKNSRMLAAGKEAARICFDHQGFVERVVSAQAEDVWYGSKAVEQLRGLKAAL